MRRRRRVLAPTFVLRDDLHQLVLLGWVRVQVVLQHRPLDHGGGFVLACQLERQRRGVQSVYFMFPERALPDLLPSLSCAFLRETGQCNENGTKSQNSWVRVLAPPLAVKGRWVIYSLSHLLSQCHGIFPY